MEAWKSTDTSSVTTEAKQKGFHFTTSSVYPTHETKDDHRSNSSFKKKLLHDLEDFSQNTTLHGLNFVTSKESSIARRFTWSLIVAAMMMIFIYIGIISNVLRYIDRPINTVISMNYVDDMDFPAVTFCNYNQWKVSLVTPEVLEVLEMTSFLNNGNTDEQALVYLKSVDNNVFTNIFNMTHTLEDMLFDCWWKNVERCSVRDFQQILTEWGVCYTFNNPSNFSDVRTVEQSGSNYGLSMRINIDQNEYIFGDNSGAGIRILVHKQGQLPLVKSLGFSISPGFESHVGIKHTKVENLPSPYSSNCRKEPLKFSPYTVQTCNYQCYVDYVTETCNCREYRMPGDARICDAYETVTCVNNASSEFVLGERKCQCPTACTADMYDVKVSTTYWPSSYVYNMFLKPLNITEDDGRKNILDVKIYFEELSFEKVEQVPAYTVASLLGDIGGFMGLLCGMSLTTLFEFLDFIVCAVNKKWKLRDPKN